MSEEALNIDIDELLEETPPQEAPPEEKPPVTFSEDQQKIFDDAIAKKVGKMREAERASEKLQLELEEARKEIPKPVRPDVPANPDPYDDNYDAKMEARDNSIREAAAFDAVTEANVRRQQEEEATRVADLQKAAAEIIDGYADRAKKLNIIPADLQAAANVVGQEGLTDQVVGYILELDQGPAVTMYLSKNPQVLNDLKQMSPNAAVVHIATEIKASAMAEQGKEPPPPAPTETLRGAGIPEGERGPPGATYE